jgi:hypothetical protein
MELLLRAAQAQITSSDAKNKEAALRVQDAEDCAERAEAEAKTARESASSAQVSCTHAVLRAEKEARERRVAEATLKASQLEVGSSL